MHMYIYIRVSICEYIIIFTYAVVISQKIEDDEISPAKMMFKPRMKSRPLQRSESFDLSSLRAAGKRGGKGGVEGKKKTT